MIERLNPDLSPIEAARRLSRLPHLAFLDSALAGSPHSRHSFLAADPVTVFSTLNGQAYIDGRAVEGHPLDVLRHLLARHAPAKPEKGFHGGAIGYFAYEFGRHTETFPAYADAPAVPDAWFGIYDTFLRFDHITGESWLITVSEDAQKLERFRRQLVIPAPRLQPLPALDWKVDFGAEAFCAKVTELRQRIHDGEVFQVNLARRFAARRPEGFDALGFYHRLRSANPAPFAAFLDCGNVQLASSSPERFLKLASGQVEARPIKGTIARARSEAEDARARQALAASAKDRAENVMIVDLLRNDLSKVAKPFSVKVPSLCAVESYANLHHLVSTVEAELKEGRDGFDLIHAAFPGGSITGAPKVKAMELIEKLEGKRRGAYCGAIGWIGFSGDLDLNIAIRTVTLTEDEISFQSGGGITWGSDPMQEYHETEVKAARIKAAFQPVAEAELAL